MAGGFRERSPLRREGGEGFRAGDGYGEMLRTNPRGAREFSPDNRFVEGVLRTVEWMFSGPVMPGERRAVINQLDDELRRIHDNRPWYGEAQVVANLIQHGREQLRDGWLRSNYNGIWFLTERSEEELRDPRVRAREEEEYRRRIANPAAAGREELEMRREAMGEVRYQQERIQRREEERHAGAEERQRRRRQERGEVLVREEERLEQLERREHRQYIDDILDEVADQLQENRNIMEDYYRAWHGEDGRGPREEARPFPAEARENPELGREREMRRARRRLQKEPFNELTKLKAAHPAIMEWRHRLRVYEEILRTSHPQQRDHINRVLDVEKKRVTEDAKAILRYRGIAGLRTTLDISWPPKDVINIDIDTSEQDSETDEERERGDRRPPAGCRPRMRSPNGRDRDQDRDRRERAPRLR